MPYTFKVEKGQVAVIDKKTGKTKFHSKSLAKAKKAAREREVFKHMK